MTGASAGSTGSASPLLSDYMRSLIQTTRPAGNNGLPSPPTVDPVTAPEKEPLPPGAVVNGTPDPVMAAMLQQLEYTKQGPLTLPASATTRVMQTGGSGGGTNPALMVLLLVVVVGGGYFLMTKKGKKHGGHERKAQDVEP